jgi:redox-sensitive bicupin YhaK (pirin superfamily)
VPECNFNSNLSKCLLVRTVYLHFTDLSAPETSSKLGSSEGDLFMKKLSFIQRAERPHWVGDGFPVRTMFSYNDLAKELSPFLLLDYAGPTVFEPTNKRRGVGEHPHRGFETVTIVYDGEVEHRDSSGGGGTISSGDVQWMTAASGLVHEEFHGPAFAQKGGPFEMIQLWVNLPAEDKKAAPGYQSITSAQIPRVALPNDGGAVRVIAGEYNHHAGPARTFTPMNVWDVRVNTGHRAEFELPTGHTTALFVLKGSLRLPSGETMRSAELAVFDPTDPVLAFEALEGTTLLLLNGKPLNEPIIGYGPFVMNTPAEIKQAFADYESGRMGHLK